MFIVIGSLFVLYMKSTVGGYIPNETEGCMGIATKKLSVQTAYLWLSRFPFLQSCHLFKMQLQTTMNLLLLFV